MASVWCSRYCVLEAPVPSKPLKQGLTKCNRLQQRVFCCSRNYEQNHPNPGESKSKSKIIYSSATAAATATATIEKKDNSSSSSSSSSSGSGRIISRRQVLLLIQISAATSSLSSLASAPAAHNSPADFRLYSDEINKFKIMIPQDWEVGSGENNGVRSIIGFYPAEPSGSNVTVVITGIGADFTRLESFGKVDAFAENLVSGLDRSWQRPPGVAAKLRDSKAANGLYYIDYTLQNPGETRRHLYSVLGISNNGWYNRLYTVTGQYIDEETAKYGPQVEKAVASFRLV